MIRTVHVRLPQDCLNWHIAKEVIRSQYRGALFLSQGSRTGWYPPGDQCAERDPCPHWRMRYTFRISV